MRIKKVVTLTAGGGTMSGEGKSDPFSKGYKHRDGDPVSDACGDGKHSECTQDFTKCGCTYRSGHTTMHAYCNPLDFKKVDQ